MITESTIPMIIVPVTFLFVLLVILIAKAPKVGAWVVGGLLFLAPVLLWRLAMTGALHHEEAIPLVVVPVTFLFILLVILLAKAPKVGAGLIVALVAMVVLSLFFMPALSHRRTAYDARDNAVIVSQSREHGAGVVIVKDGESKTLTVPESPLSLPLPLPSVPQPPSVPSPIWSEGLEQEFEADVCPSRLAAVRALGRQMRTSIRQAVADMNVPARIVIFQEEHERALVIEFKKAIERALPDVPCSVAGGSRNIGWDEIGITLRFVGVQTQSAPWDRSGSTQASTGDVLASARSRDWEATARQRFVDKPWIDNFAAFAGTRPNEHFIVVRSNGTCTSESEAREQALNDARARLTEALGSRTPQEFPGLPQPAITTQDVLQGDFVVDQFAQSFEGSAGRIWRQAMLIDVSGSKLAQLAQQKAREMRSERMSWARMGFSVIGVVVLIGAIYFFLNMATMGYYEWSLRIAGIVLAIVAVFSILMIVR